ncbi:MAG: tripartite tricarboxylate transporter permease [Gammaproteobacteria bacterium]|uniref:tripartite tricarboxylate transporter permease n=1 Tax=Limnobacter sp. TaxID=2003368 RepID=UPI001DDA2EFF|nr:tripartite tricarboxylate transporter permease [Limnobacter sp.]MBU0784705.1 tripartite tricarboxylate transporter permease [Gammaproteobacteria bacterium]MBU0848090.1 tripartite tricarboxylate transporter permease [Gammaproteobacteria bacterium]MBU1267629.1 tripartite tricarboxylate transporter permease [Gammaproteobacteria bacterium]MBU1529990.1 tripartite tricarboxylate transporter permease [Gammaproteobacteria bacterium]MBU1779873.1 tripartite tricarboxylate transporter permease [Gammap
MELLSNLSLGLETALTLNNLFFCLVGVFLGTAIGVLPGLGPTATIAMLLPITFGLPPVSSLIMLSGIYYGAQYGGSTTAILVNLPGESSSVVTALDGYQMAKQGRAGKALATAAIGSFFAGTVATLLLALFAPPLADIALQFGAAEYFSLMVVGLVASVVLASGSLLQALGMIVLGLLLGMAGTDVNSGLERYTFETPYMAEGINFVILAMGMFGLGEIIKNLEEEHLRSAMVAKVHGLMPNKEDFKRMAWPIIRGTGLGSLLGILPGGGAMLASFASYSIEKKISKTPEQFGKGAIEGVAGPESANNAGAQTSFIPLLTLGIPSNPVMALMIGAMIIQGITPGPAVMTEQPTLFWGIIVSMWIGNLFLVVLNLPLIGIWVKMISVPYHFLYPAILVFCCIGAFSLGNKVFDIYLLAGFGVLGYIFSKLKCEPAPLLLGFILGPMMEEYLRRALLLSRGDVTVLVTRPISATMLAIAVIALIVVFLPSIQKKREEAFHEE